MVGKLHGPGPLTPLNRQDAASNGLDDPKRKASVFFDADGAGEIYSPPPGAKGGGEVEIISSRIQGALIPAQFGQRAPLPAGSNPGIEQAIAKSGLSGTAAGNVRAKLIQAFTLFGYNGHESFRGEFRVGAVPILVGDGPTAKEGWEFTVERVDIGGLVEERYMLRVIPETKA
jgi:hypothetical protein